MARARTRVKRSFYLLVALCVLALLLELNRFLPGAWPGGGGGFRSSMNVGASVPQPDRGRDVEPAPPDVSEVVPPAEPPATWPPREALHIEVRGPHGDRETRWRLGTGGAGRENLEPDSRGVVRTKAPALFTEGFRVRTNAGVLRHEHGLGEPAAKWVVQRPSGELPRQRQPGRAGVRVVDAATGDPIEGAQVTWHVDGRRHDVVSDATGEAVVRGARGGGPVRVELLAEGHAHRKAWVSPREGEPRTVALESLGHVQTRYELGADPAARPTLARLLGAGGREIQRIAVVSPLDDPTPVAVVLRAPRRELDGAWVETAVTTPQGVFCFRVPADQLEPVTKVPAYRVIGLRLRDASGRTIEGAVPILADYGTHRGDVEEPRDSTRRESTPDDTGLHRAVVPRDVAVRLLVEPPGSRPIVRTLTPVDGRDELEFVVEPGIEVPVGVQDADGAPLAGARVVARASMDGIRIVQEGETDAKGRARVGPFAAGPVEIFVVADGHACAAVLAEAQAAMGTVAVQLQRGYRLTLVVEDPFGIPLEGVEVTVTPADGGLPLVSEPDAGDWRTDAEGRLRIEHLPNRIYDVGLSLPGHGPVKLRRVQPGAVTYFATLLRD